MLSVHTSPLHQPGTGDAGGMNVYMVQLARALAAKGAEIDVFTRCRGEGLPARVPLADLVTVHHLHAGPCGPLAKEALPGTLSAFSRDLLRAAEQRRPYDVVHSHYWLSGQVGRAVAGQWRVPLVHTMHTLGRVKNASLAPGDSAEPAARILGEHQVIDAADRLIANTADEAAALHDLYGAETTRTDIVRPGVDTETFSPGAGRDVARRRLGLPPDAFIPLFVGRIQPLKGPDVLIRALAELLDLAPELRMRLLAPVIGGLSGSGTHAPGLPALCRQLGVDDVVRMEPAVRQRVLADWYRAADVLVVPSRSESFGLVAVEAQACGTPVLAARVGGLPTAVQDGRTGVLLDGHRPADYARSLLALARAPRRARAMGWAGVRHAAGMAWETAADATLATYERAAWTARRGWAGAAARPCPGGIPPLEVLDSRRFRGCSPKRRRADERTINLVSSSIERIAEN
ncbi:D-inositol-3-phosphate glycosyltransferase [Streptomyces purpurogeneiscleroticus]|uniref:D-inositol-3-phosphate glycosyltransferase n=1 Tax=Streptomyces purpurogeneiscleroticus TaxID=68259 RepID=UPI001CBB02C5|nr:D-inositol-3-phosphate glycosyltransferase [Streptomyces purpurogeneiscleroticus]MBZ4015131.1 D-inositol-3-phosphate glycosyltransferase [Streptomyces purpurogeneiscleroticus]